MAIHSDYSHSSPIYDLTDTQRRELAQYLAVHRRSGEYCQEPLRLALVLAGEKPATIIDSPGDVFPDCPLSATKCVERLLNQFDLAYRATKGVTGWTVAPTSARLDLLPTVTRICEAYHRRLGVIFGYPRAAIEAFVERFQQDIQPTHPREYIRRGVFEITELAYSGFVFYMPRDSEEGYRRAIATGKKNYARFCELAHEWGLPDLVGIANTIYQRNIAVYSGEIDSCVDPL